MFMYGVSLADIHSVVRDVSTALFSSPRAVVPCVQAAGRTSDLFLFLICPFYT